MMTEIIYPLATLAILTILILFTIGVGRVLAIKSRQVSIKSFRLMEGKSALSPKLQQLDRNFSNLLEVPVLFYVWGLLVLILGLQDNGLLQMAWAYAVLRLVHSFIHITYNNVNHRFLMFVVSCLLLLVMWVRLLTLI